jgi:glucose-6-phosphate 1-dehydrogenase
MNMKLSKAQKKHLRQLTGIAYERDLARCLNDLKSNFDQWESGEISVWDLNDKIHEFHNETARELYKVYASMADPVFAVASGIRHSVLDVEEIQKDCMPLIQPIVDYFNDNQDLQIIEK